mmetsp:Transcript_125324/g.401365  ORF Transcript_125324/g.401365 Transcript_125324/m.401365 type:complete len:99 (-) Transcript_125324:150-446(-)
MRSAFLHVGADFLRSLTTVVEGLAVLFANTDGRATDDIASWIVSSTIFIGALFALASWSQQARTCCRLKSGPAQEAEFPAAILGSPMSESHEERNTAT